MKKLLLATSITSLLCGCDANLGGVSTSPVSKAVDTSGMSSATYGQRALEDSWPEQAAEDVFISDNLLTKNYYFAVDGSGSMNAGGCAGGISKILAAKKAVSTFISKLPEDVNLGLFVFDNRGTSERVSINTGNKADILNKVNMIDAGGGTPLKEAVNKGYLSLNAQAQKQLGYGEYNLVIITDGAAGIGSDPRGAVDQLLHKSPVNVHTIGFCIGTDHALNQPGKTYYKAADDPASLMAGLESVLAESPDFSVTSFD